jgi:hypothetical protein
LFSGHSDLGLDGSASSAKRISVSIVSSSVPEKSSRQCARTAFKALTISPQLSGKPLNAKYGPNNRESGLRARWSHHEINVASNDRKELNVVPDGHHGRNL